MLIAWKIPSIYAMLAPAWCPINYYKLNWLYFCSKQGGAVEACWAHNPEVSGSKPFPAIVCHHLKMSATHSLKRFFFGIFCMYCLFLSLERNKQQKPPLIWIGLKLATQEIKEILTFFQEFLLNSILLQ